LNHLYREHINDNETDKHTDRQRENTFYLSCNTRYIETLADVKMNAH